MNDPTYDDWKRARANAPVSEEFAGRVLEAVEGNAGSARPRVRLGGVARAALVVLALGALLFRIGSTLALILST